ncbi:MAG: hypothetical protein U0271_16935 [Polyangiaceae bacterium]
MIRSRNRFALTLAALSGAAAFGFGVSEARANDMDPSESRALAVLHLYAGPMFEIPLERPNDVPLGAWGLNLGASYQIWEKPGGSWGFWISPEIGYAGRQIAEDDLYHAGQIAFGFGVGSRWAFISATPRLSVGAVNDDVYGMISTGITGHFLLEILRLEASHEILIGARDTKQFLTSTLSIDLVVLAMALAAD